MQARGPLMIEHRLIERMIALIERQVEQIESDQSVDPVLVDTIVDFIKTYADRTHHGKEEEIFFVALEKKPLSDQDRRVMHELIEEHVFGRKTTGNLVEANSRYRDGEPSALQDLVSGLQTLSDFYPQHIEKEDKIFFPASRAYFSEAEDRSLLERFWEFDRNMIHEKYRAVLTDMESRW